MHNIVFGHLKKDVNSILEEKTNSGNLISIFQRHVEKLENNIEP